MKKLVGLSIAYFTTWGVHGNLVNSYPLLKKGYRYGWFVVEGEWAEVSRVKVRVCKSRTPLTKIVRVSFLFFFLYIRLSYGFFLLSVLLRTFCKYHLFQKNMLSSRGRKKSE